MPFIGGPEFTSWEALGNWIIKTVTSISKDRTGPSVQAATRGAGLEMEDEFAGAIGPVVGAYDPEIESRFIQEW